jgi:DNA-binding response OmpR family regulator
MGAQVLVVEDDATLQRAFVDFLGDEGYVCRAVGSVDEANAALAEGNTDVVILDLALDRESGETLLRSLSGSLTGPVVVAMSASPSLRAIAERYGVDFVAKPFSLQILEQVLAGAVRRSATRTRTVK